jgi:hypothetical protein
MGTWRTFRSDSDDGMGSRRLADELLSLLHRAGWSIGDTALCNAEGVYWPVYGNQGGYEIHAENRNRGEGRRKACREAEVLGLIEPL